MTSARAIADARTRMHAGMAPALAIWKTSREYGCSSRALAVAVRGKHTTRRQAVPQLEAWWNR